MVSEFALAARILVLHQVRSAPSWQPKIAAFPNPQARFMIRLRHLLLEFLPFCALLHFERMGSISETTVASPFAKSL